MPFVEHYVTLPLILKNTKFSMLLVKSNIFGTILNTQWTAIAQSVYRLATGWTVRASNPGGEKIFSTRADRHWSLPSIL